MPVIMDGMAIIPAPLVEITKNMQTLGDGTKAGVLYNLTITGKIVAYKGSPQYGSLTGIYWSGPFNRFWTGPGYPPDESIPDSTRLKSIENKQEALRSLFANDGKYLEFMSPDGSAALKCQPRIKDIHFNADIWYQTCDYVITAESDYLYLNGNPEIDTPYHTELISSANESWNIEEGEVAKTYRLSHNVGAVGKRKFDNTGAQVGLAWQNAKSFVVNRLAIGFNNPTSFSPIAGQAIVSGSVMNSGSVINFSTLQPYNFSRSESIDEFAGSYNLTETWLLSPASSGTDVYTVSVKKMSEEPNTTTNVTIQGSIKGFYTNLSDFDGRFEAAKYTWSQLQGNPLYARISAYATGITFNSQPTMAAVDYNKLEGTINYNYSYDDRLIFGSGDVYDEYIINKKNDMTDYRVTVGIQGKITGRFYETDTTKSVKFNRALAYWNTIKNTPTIYNRIISLNYFPETSSSLRQNPVAANVDMDQSNGIISYSFDFNTRTNDNNQNNEDVIDSYTVSTSFNREDGKTIYSINGTVEGLSISAIDASGKLQKYNSANNYFVNVVQPLIYSRVLSYGNATIYNTNPIETSIERNPTLGTVSYAYKYTNEPAPLVANALTELITVHDSNKNSNINVFAMLPILNRSAGPILQSIGTTKEKIRDLDIEIVVVPTGSSSLSTQMSYKPNVDTIVTQLTPVGSQVFVDDDNESWTFRNGRYNRHVRWVYQS